MTIWGRPRRQVALAALWLVPAVWSSNYLIARAAAGRVPPHVLAFGRWAIVAAVLLALSARSLRAEPGRLRAERGRLLVLGALGMWICGAWVYLGARSTSATHIGLIYAAAPVGIALWSQRRLGERLAPAQAAAMGMALAGVLLVILQGDPSRLLAVRFGSGDLWIVAATLSWILYSVLLQAWPTRFSGAERLGLTAAAGLLPLAPFAAWELTTLPAPIPPAGWGLVLLAALLPGLVSYLAYGFIQAELGAARAALMMYLAPVYAAGLAWALLGEAPRGYHAVAALLILPSIHIASRRGAPA